MDPVLFVNATLSTMSMFGQDDHHHDDVPCGDVHKVNTSYQCDFVNATDSCHIEEGIFDYTVFMYCTLGARLLGLAVTILIVWLVFLFVSLAITADDFFCPALEVMAKTMRMSDNIAGVTLLAFGNGAPDVFSAISAVQNMKNGDVGLVFGALLGAGVFLTTVVAGAVCIVGTFHAMERPFLRDLIFYLVTVFVTFVICWDGEITLFEALFYFFAYFAYVGVVVIGRLIYKWQKSRAASQRVNDSVAETSDTDHTSECVVDRSREVSSDGGCEHVIVSPGVNSVNNVLYSSTSEQQSDSEENTPLLHAAVVDRIQRLRLGF